MGSKYRNDDLSTEQMKEKLRAQALKIKELTTKNVTLEKQLAGAKVTSSFVNKLALYQKAIQDAQANEKTEDLIEHILNAFAKGHVDVTLLLYQFCIVQFKFLAMDTFPASHGQLLYQTSDVVKKFSLNFFNNSKASYALLRGYSECDLFRNRTEAEESIGMDDRSIKLFQGNFVLPGDRYCQKKNAEGFGENGVFGFVQKQLECIVSHFESVRSIYEDGAPIFASISIDESDWGQPEIRWCNQRGIVGATEFDEVTDLINEEGLEWKYAGVDEEDFKKQMKSSEVEKDLRCMEEQLRIDQLEDSSLSFDYTVVQTVGYITSELLGFEEHLTNFVQTSYEKLEAYVKKNKLRLRFDENGLIVSADGAHRLLLKHKNWLENIHLKALDDKDQMVKLLLECQAQA